MQIKLKIFSMAVVKIECMQIKLKIFSMAVVKMTVLASRPRYRLL